MLELLNLYRADAQHIASFALGLAVLRYGGGPERATGVVFVVIVILPGVFARMTGLSASALFGELAWLYVLLDTVAAVAFIAIALMANRNYPMWIAGFQLVSMSAHLVRGLVDSVSPLAYVILAVGPSYGQLLLLAGGLTFHRLRLHRYGPYREWRAAAPANGWRWLAADYRREPHV